MAGDLPSIKEKEDGDLCFICCGATIIIVLVVLVLAVLIAVITRGRKKKGDEKWEE
jgi:heme/copper-type cytochrome/quinol oxidase subunit 2